MSVSSTGSESAKKNPGKQNDAKSRRITIDVSPSAATEIDRMTEITGQTTADLFRSAFSLLRLYVNYQLDKKEICAVDPTGRVSPTRIELVFPNPIQHEVPADAG